MRFALESGFKIIETCPPDYLPCSPQKLIHDSAWLALTLLAEPYQGVHNSYTQHCEVTLWYKFFV